MSIEFVCKPRRVFIYWKKGSEVKVKLHIFIKGHTNLLKNCMIGEGTRSMNIDTRLVTGTQIFISRKKHNKNIQLKRDRLS